MIFRRVEDLDAWHVAGELKREVYALIATGPAAKDFKFRDQIRDAAASVLRNISEGFGRLQPHDFARFKDYTIASLMEVRECLFDGVNRGHFTDQSIQCAVQLTKRSLQVSRGLKRYPRCCRPHPFRPAQRSTTRIERSPNPPERSAKPPNEPRSLGERLS